MHLVGFIIRIYHDARSPERQKSDHLCLHRQYGLVFVVVLNIPELKSCMFNLFR